MNSKKTSRSAGSKRNFSRKKKRKWNCVVPKEVLANTKKPPDEPSCSSERKLASDLPIPDSSSTNYFMLTHFSVVESIVKSLNCPECFGTVNLTDEISKRCGYAHSLTIKCEEPVCMWSKSFSTSPEIKKEKQSKGRNMYEVNVRSVIAFREIGCGYASMNTFSSLMNVKCLSETPFQHINKKVMVSYKNVAMNSMKVAASEAPRVDIVNEMPCTRVSVDGSWQRRGHASLHGVVTAIAGEKCVDVEIKSRHCFGCKMWKGKENSSEYEIWKLGHYCQINHDRSSGAMESTGAVDIFSRSVSQNNLIYKEYLGDGDTSSFADVVKSKPYEAYDVIPVKLECIGHVQKRLGTRLRNMVKSHKGTKTPLSGRGKLTDKCINSMQNYYGMAIRRNITNLYAMKKAVFAIMFHFTDIPNLSERHKFCPRDVDTWCRYWKDSTTYKPHSSIPIWIKDLLVPTFRSLQDDSLLSKCLHGKTQNSNEALNGIIWSRVPKTTFVSRETIEMGTYSAVIHFNDGFKGILQVLNHFKLKGHVTESKAVHRDRMRIRQMKRKSTDKCIKQRKKLRSLAKGYSDKLKEKEPRESYVTGGH